jgi:TPR repeat protein
MLPIAEQGDASAQYNLGVMYANGYGVPQDYAEAVRWYRLAAGQGNAKAQYNLGLMYYNGEGVPQDYAVWR